MRRSIVHQTKWLVFGLLKTTASALATTTGDAKSSTTVSSSLHFVRMMTSMSSSSATLLPQRHLPPREPFDQPPRPGLHPEQQQQHRWKQPSTGGGSPPDHPLEASTIVLRLARPADVRGISTCNLQTLPENYNDQFYLNHLAEWPDLAFVAVLESSPPSQQLSSRSQNYPTTTTQQPLHSNYQPKSMLPHQQQQQPHNGFVRNFQARFSFLPYSSKATVTPSSKVVAYLLGKTCQQQQQYVHYSLEGGGASAYDDYGRYTLDSPMQQQQPMIVGHVSSLAVLPEFRRRGLADSMLEQFHAHLQQQSVVVSSLVEGSTTTTPVVPSSTGLHVRRSNAAAVRLYQKRGYTPAVCIPAYYEDGEDAYYMQKHFRSARSSTSSSNGNRSSSPFGGTNCGSMALPRVVGGMEDDDDGVPQLQRTSI